MRLAGNDFLENVIGLDPIGTGVPRLGWADFCPRESAAIGGESLHCYRHAPANAAALPPSFNACPCLSVAFSSVPANRQSTRPPLSLPLPVFLKGLGGRLSIMPSIEELFYGDTTHGVFLPPVWKGILLFVHRGKKRYRQKGRIYLSLLV